MILDFTNRLTSVEVDHYKRFKGKSNYNFFKSFQVFLKTLTSFSVIPLRIATVTGLISSIAGFVMAAYFMIKYFFISYEVEGWTSLIVSLFIIGGILLMSLGLVGEYIGRMFVTLNKKPQYSVSEIIKKQP
jgi:undecaprenyl-phosphate 4-deoxy-4-formamido-L-arabinose transferase